MGVYQAKVLQEKQDWERLKKVQEEKMAEMGKNGLQKGEEWERLNKLHKQEMEEMDKKRKQHREEWENLQEIQGQKSRELERIKAENQRLQSQLESQQSENGGFFFKLAKILKNVWEIVSVLIFFNTPVWLMIYLFFFSDTYINQTFHVISSLVLASLIGKIWKFSDVRSLEE